MRLSLERLLWLMAPLFAAAAASRKKRGVKPAKKKSRPAAARSPKSRRAEKPARRAARALVRKTLARRNKGALRGRPAPPTKPTPKAAVTEPAEPLPKPVPPVGRPILLSPEQGKYADSLNPKFRWLSVGGATRYEVSWGHDPNLANAYTVISVATEAAVPVEKPLSVGVTYYWRARGGNVAGWGPWSNVGSFSVLEETEQAQGH